MISEALDIFRRNKRFEPRWFKILRSAIAILFLMGITIYLGALIFELNRKETYITSTRVSRRDTNYNPHFPFPDFFSAGYSMNMSTWAPPYIDTKCALEYVSRNGSFYNVRYPGCIGLLNQYVDSAGQMIVYNYVNLSSSIYFKDYTSCNLLPDPQPSYCNGIQSFGMSFRLPPNVTISPYATFNLMVRTEYTGVLEDFENLVYEMMVYSIIPGQSLRIQLDYTENHDIAGNVFYTNTQSQTTSVVPLDSTEILDSRVVGVTIWANTASYTVTYERYYHTWGELFGLIGGLYGGVASAFVLLFGATRFSPWGLVQKTILKRALTGPLRENLNPPNSIVHSSTPIAERAPMSFGDNTIETVLLRERLEKLEIFLSSYVIDRGLLDSDMERQMDMERKADMSSKTLLEEWEGQEK